MADMMTVLENKNGNKIRAMHFPYRKKMVLAVYDKHTNAYIKMATFNNDEAAEEFMEYLSKFVGAAEPVTKSHKNEPVGDSDTISRRAAIDAVMITPQEWDGTYIQDLNCKLRDALNALPSAQPEPLTDKEQRIFLAAMGREEKVCKQVDEESRDCCEHYESLVSVCRKITRKVKGALWT